MPGGPAPRPAQRPAPQPAQPRLDPHPARARMDAPLGPPREVGGNGSMRGIAALIFLLVVAGGGYYMYQQFRGPGAEKIDTAEDWEGPLASSNPADDGVAGSGAVGDANQVASGPSRNEAPRQAAPRQAPRETEPEALPQPTLRTLPTAAAPVSPPRPSEGDPEVASSMFRDPSPVPAATTAVQPAVVTPPPPAVRPPSRPRWAQRAGGRDLSDAYPPAAARRNIEGRVVMDCLIGANLAIVCRVTSETPGGYGFAAAALRVAQKYRSAPTLEDGRPAAGERTTIAISFKPAA